MKQYLIYLLLLIILPLQGLAQKSKYNGVGRWRAHFPFKSVKQIQEAGDYIFVLPEKGFFTFHQPSGEINLYSKVNGFSDIDVSLMRYVPELNKMIFVYATGNIDILDLKTNKVINLPDILRKSILGEKEFYDIQYFDNKAYLSSSLGIILIDINKLEISDSYQNIGPFGAVIPVYSTVRYNNYLYAGTNKGLMRAKATNTNLSDYQNWQIVKPGIESKLLRVFNNKLYAVNDSIYEMYDDVAWQPVRSNHRRIVQSLELCHNKLIETHWGGFLISDTNGNVDSVRENRVMFGILDGFDCIWTGGESLGLFKINKQGVYGFFGINGPEGITTNTIAGWRDEIWVTSGGPGFVYGPTFNGAGYYHFTNNEWLNRPQDPPALRQMYDFESIAINENTGEVWLGTHGTGIARLKDGKFVERFDDTNSTLRKQAGLFTLVPGLALDSKNNLWAANYDADSCVSVRFVNGTWKNFKLSTKFVGEMVIDDYDQKWMITPRIGSSGLVVFKEAANGKGQRDRLLMKGKGLGDLPSNRVNALVVDKDNEIWIGTDEGLAVFFNPARAFETEEDAQRIIVDQNGVVGYLLGNESINDMAVDGANRKWVATNNGAFLIEKDGTSVLEHFTTDNSPLPSNIIKAVGVNGVTGEVFFGTEKGMVSYGGNATEAGDKHTEVKIYPNPVRENYNGDITITGLPDYATVKITDVSGRIIYETLSNGGIATWNGRLFNGEKPHTGIYLIFSSNKEDRESLVSKMLIVN
jgi:ligand-binding sensor domain-containing protein